jgi:hypothetical protein
MKICGLLDWNTNNTYKKIANKVYKWSIVIAHIYILIIGCINLSQYTSFNTFLKSLWRFFVVFTFGLNYLFLSQIGSKIKELFCIPEKYLCYKFKFTKAANKTIRKVCIHYGIIFVILISTIVSAVITVRNIETAAVTENNTPTKFYFTSRTINPNINLILNIFQFLASIQFFSVSLVSNILVFYYFTIINCYYKQTILRFEGIQYYSSQIFSVENYNAMETYVKNGIILHQYVVG